MSDLEQELAEFSATYKKIEAELSRIIVGQQAIIQQTILSIFCGGHVLLEGVPGLGKTLLVNSIAKALGIDFKRIQFTPDLMPSDITGTEILNENADGQKEFTFRAGPLFAHVILADEINRATPKTQAALLEAMEEKQVTVMGKTHLLKSPFFVLATQNPIELEGTYPLPEAQLDRFFIKLILELPNEIELQEILKRTTGTNIPQAESVMSGDPIAKINNFKKLVRSVVIPGPLQEIAVRMHAALNPASEHATKTVKQYLRYGSGPRGAQSVVLFAKALALQSGRLNVDYADIQAALLPCLRHRIILNFQAEADEVTAEQIIKEISNAK